MALDPAVKALILKNRALADEELRALSAHGSVDFPVLRERIRRYVLYKFQLDPDEIETEDFSEITRLSLERSAGLSKELAAEVDSAISCDGASSAMVKKALLFNALQRGLGISLDPFAAAESVTLSDLAGAVWAAMARSESWSGRLELRAGRGGENGTVSARSGPGDRPAADTIDAVQQELYEELTSLGDGFEQYARLLELSLALAPLSDAEKTPENLVAGCQSRIWLKSRCKDDIFSFEADSDTLILKGMLRLLQLILNGQPAAAVAEADIWLLEKTELLASFALDRQKGIAGLVRAIKDSAARSTAEGASAELRERQEDHCHE